MNPADAFRKSQRQKEILRNKRERKFQRDAHALQADPDAIKDQLKDVLDQQDSGKVNLTLKLKQRALQGAYDTAVKRKKVQGPTLALACTLETALGHCLLSDKHMPQ